MIKVINLYEVQVEIENKCLMNCRHCSSYEMRQLGKRGFSEEDLIKFLNLFSRSVHIYLTGGEPLFDINTLSIIKNIKQFVPNVIIGLFSCGIINSSSGIQSVSLSLAKLLKDIGLFDCYLSLYHIEESIHDFITNMPSSYNYTTETIRNLVNVGIETKIHLIVNKYNVENLELIIHRISQMGVKEIRILRLVQSGSAIRNWADLGVPYEKQNEAILRIIHKINDFNTKITVSGFPEYYPCRSFENSVKCQAGTNLLYITYQGEICPCACTKNQRKYLIGHISELDKINKFLKDNEKRDFNEHCLNRIKL